MFSFLSLQNIMCFQINLKNKLIFGVLKYHINFWNLKPGIFTGQKKNTARPASNL